MLLHRQALAYFPNEKRNPLEPFYSEERPSKIRNRDTKDDLDASLLKCDFEGEHCSLVFLPTTMSLRAHGFSSITLRLTILEQTSARGHAPLRSAPTPTRAHLVSSVISNFAFHLIPCNKLVITSFIALWFDRFILRVLSADSQTKHNYISCEFGA